MAKLSLLFILLIVPKSIVFATESANQCDVNHIESAQPKDLKTAFLRAQEHSNNPWFKKMTFEELIAQDPQALRKMAEVWQTLMEQGPTEACDCLATNFGVKFNRRKQFFRYWYGSKDLASTVLVAGPVYAGKKLTEFIMNFLQHYAGWQKSRLKIRQHYQEHLYWGAKTKENVPTETRKVSSIIEWAERMGLKSRPGEMESDGKVSWSHDIFSGMVKVKGKKDVFKPIDASKERISIGNDMYYDGKRIIVEKVDVGMGIGFSGMSYPQLNGRVHLTFMVQAMMMARKMKSPVLYNGGEGGHMFHVALIKGDRAGLRKAMIEFLRKEKILEGGSWTHAKVEVQIERLMDLRDKMFKEFEISPEDIGNFRFVAQIGSALNGLRENFDSTRASTDRLIETLNDNVVKMWQVKIGQAAKEGSAVNASKVGEFVSWLRRILPGRKVTSPRISPEWIDTQTLGEFILLLKLITRKPVSIKVAISDLAYEMERFRILKEMDALPDHIQVDGGGIDASPGSGNMPMFGDMNFTAEQALVGMKYVLWKHDISKRVVLESSGDVYTAEEAILRHYLGAQIVSWARGAMKLGAGCSSVGHCKGGMCPYNIAASENSFLGAGYRAVSRTRRGWAALSAFTREYQFKMSHAANHTGLGAYSDFYKHSGMVSKDPRLMIHVQPEDGRSFDRNARRVFNKDRILDFLDDVNPTEADVDAFLQSF